MWHGCQDAALYHWLVTPMAKRWLLPSPITPEIDQRLSEYPALFRQILYNRGICTAEDADAFLNMTGLEYSPFMILGMQTAIDRIYRAIDRREKIVVFGDYDADGITATALMLETLGWLGNSATFYIPNRFEEGYGLNKEAIQAIANCGTKLIVTVDCGIRSANEVEFARSLGLDVIITDHHYPLGDLPPASCVICPKQSNDLSENKELAGVGLAYKVSQALLSQRRVDGVDVNSLLDLVALGTIADMVPLTGENRFLAKKGLQEIRKGKRIGLVKLAEVSGLGIQNVTSGNIGFTLAPRLNAAGRLKHDEEETMELFKFCRAACDDVYNLGLGTLSVQMLIEKDASLATKFAEKLSVLNAKRQASTREAVEKTVQVIDPETPPEFIAVVDETLSEGIIGLVASRLTDKYYRPSMVMTRTNNSEIMRASCRSISQFHITQALDKCADLMIRHGGHAAAAGLTIMKENVNELIRRLTYYAEEVLCDAEKRTPQIMIDAEIPLSRLGELNPCLEKCISLLEPTGVGNPYPVFAVKNIRIKNPTIYGKQNQSQNSSTKNITEDVHLRFSLDTGQSGSVPPVVWFRANEEAEKVIPGCVINLAFTFEKNQYKKSEYYQLQVRDICFSPSL